MKKNLKDVLAEETGKLMDRLVYENKDVVKHIANKIVKNTTKFDDGEISKTNVMDRRING